MNYDLSILFNSNSKIFRVRLSNSTVGTIAVALGSSVYLWSANTSKVICLFDLNVEHGMIFLMVHNTTIWLAFML